MKFGAIIASILIATSAFAGDPVTAIVGQSVTFTVTAEGTNRPEPIDWIGPDGNVVKLPANPFEYQWLRNGATITGATSATFTIPSVTLADARGYSCIVKNSAGQTRSDTTQLLVNPAPSQPPPDSAPNNARSSGRVGK